MTYYRLLRDNKESGPFSEEEMIAKGFKPYDLIWVEGKSAGWRYPSEIPAFKTFAPVVEEQPYDRFYKKQPPQKHFAMEEKNIHPNYIPVTEKIHGPAPIAPVQAEYKQPAPEYKQPVPEYKLQSLPGRHIHVTLPSGNTVNLTTLVSKKETREVKEISETAKTAVSAAGVYSESKQSLFTAPVYNSAIPATKENNKDFTAAAYYNNPEKNDTATVSAYLPQATSGQQTIAGFSWSLMAASCIGIATLVGLGIMIGLSIRSNKTDLAYKDSNNYKSKQASLPASNNIKTPAVNSSTQDAPVIATHEIVRPVSDAVKGLVQNAVVKNTVLPDDNEIKEIKKQAEEKIAADKNKPLAKPEDLPTHATMVVPPVNIEKDLSLSESKFKTGALGGISGLKCTLTNGSKFSLESVEVEIAYIQANNKIYKTAKVLFSNIAAGAQATAEAPSSSRGIKVISRIIKVNTKEGTLSNTTVKS